MYEIIFYNKEDGKVPVEEFLDSLSPKLLAKTLKDIDLLEKFGNNLREPFSKKLSDGIFELRTKQSSDITRIFYFFICELRVNLINSKFASLLFVVRFIG